MWTENNVCNSLPPVNFGRFILDLTIRTFDIVICTTAGICIPKTRYFNWVILWFPYINSICLKNAGDLSRYRVEDQILRRKKTKGTFTNIFLSHWNQMNYILFMHDCFSMEIATSIPSKIYTLLQWVVWQPLSIS